MTIKVKFKMMFFVIPADCGFISNILLIFAPVVARSNVRMRVHELRSHMSSGREAEQISFENSHNPDMDEPESSDPLPPPLRRQNAMWGKELLRDSPR